MFLADLSYWIGLIGHCEHSERLAIIAWLSDDAADDPRSPLDFGDEDPGFCDSEVGKDMGKVEPETKQDSPDAPDLLELVVLNQWYFTGSDPDNYPSVPHGHLNSADRPWPKLDPYTGRAYKAKCSEDSRYRLTKKKMRELWSNPEFRNFCRAHILWYMEAHSHYSFRVSHPLRFPRW